MRRPVVAVAAAGLAVAVAAAGGGYAAGRAHPRIITRTVTLTRAAPARTVTRWHTRTVTRWHTRTVTRTAAEAFHVGAGRIGCWQGPVTGLPGPNNSPRVTTDGTGPPGSTFTTCTITAQTPAYLDQWLITAPDGARSVVVISNPAGGGG